MTGLIRNTGTNTSSANIGPDEERGHSPLFPLTEHYVMKKTIKHWLPPKYPSYDLIDARLTSFKNWPVGKLPSPESLSEAGFI